MKAENIHINIPKVDTFSLDRGTCPDCKQRVWFALFHMPWYGWDRTCLNCGRQWQGGEWMPLVFERRSRLNSIDRAKRRFCRCLAG